VPKYIPTNEDLYKIKKCVICDSDTGDENRDTCSWQCRNEKDYFNNWQEELLYIDALKDLKN